MRHLPDPVCLGVVGVVNRTYTSKRPLVGKSKLTTRDKGGIGKDLSDGYTINMAIGCLHGCPFCYVDEIIEKFHKARHGITEPWGEYLIVREGIRDLAASTNWEKYRGKEILMSSTHDPYLPCLQGGTREILRHALPHGVKFRIQTRQIGFLGEEDLFKAYPDQVQVQVSVCTWHEALRRIVEPRILPTQDRLRALRAIEGVRKGVIMAPLVPACEVRCAAPFDIIQVAKSIKFHVPDVDHVYGEVLHIRGDNLERMNHLLGVKMTRASLKKWDEDAEGVFYAVMGDLNIDATFWREHR